VAVAGLLAAGIGVSERFEGRQTVFGQGPNTISAVVALGAVMLIGTAYGRARARRMTKIAAWTGFLIVAVAITRTGSRGALVGLGAGLMTLLVSRGSLRTRMRNAVILVLALAVCFWVSMASVTAAARWRETLEGGSMSGREVIFRVAWGMVKEKPILGWGGPMNFYELGRRLHRPSRDTHNLFLWLLTEVGLVGTIPFCIGLVLCVRAAWRGRKGTQGILPLALVVATLTVNLVDTFYELKSFWVILAYSLASEPSLRVRWKRLTVRSVNQVRFVALARSGTATGTVRQRPASVPMRRRAHSEIGHEPII
jgi:O-antigen ligase